MLELGLMDFGIHFQYHDVRLRLNNEKKHTMDKIDEMYAIRLLDKIDIVFNGHALDTMEVRWT